MLIDQTLSCKHNFVISEFTLYELDRVGVEYEMFLAVLKSLQKFKSCSLEESEKDLARKDINTHLQDAIHIALCEKSGADILLTANIKDFKHYSKARTYDDI